MPPLMREPTLDRRQRVRRYAYETPLPVNPSLDQPSALEYLQMPRDRLCAHRKRRSNLTHTEFALEQPFNDCAARGIGECREDSVEFRLLCRLCMTDLTQLVC